MSAAQNSATLLLRLAGPMQSWGTQSRFSDRDTGLEPSKSGVIGLICSALGRPRAAAVDDLAALRMGVRVDREGIMRRDYQTAGGWHRQAEADYGVPGPDGKGRRTVISNRYYLADADFLVGLEGDRTLLERVESALRRPHWQLFLGRKGFVPGVPVVLPDQPPWGPGLRSVPLMDTLRSYPWLGYQYARVRDMRPERLRLMLDADEREGAEVRADVPQSFAERTFTLRRVRTDWVPLSALEDPCISPGSS